jgi:predicted anti-sigma-YlaC factor YlaD
MQCKTLHKNLIFFLERDLPEKEMKKVEAHLIKCPDCKAFSMEMKKTLGIIEEEKQVEVNPFFYTRLKARLENQEIQKQPFWQPVFSKVLQPAFFSIILLLGIYGGIKMGEPYENQRSSTILAEQDMVPYLNEMSAEPIESFLME